jgi:hypothetical protein
MKKLLLFIPFIIMVVSGCITINVPANKTMSPTTTPDNKTTSSTTVPDIKKMPPTAYIDSIQPAKANAGEIISFNSHGTDTDGIIIGYEWRSSLDGILSTVANFKTSSLSVGTHNIYLRVIDNSNLWSAEANSTILVTMKVTKPVIESFVAYPSSIVRGGATELRWNVSGTGTVFIDNGIGQVTASGFKILYPSVNTVYTLTASNEGGSVVKAFSVTVQESVAVGNPVITFTAQHLGGNSWQLNWNVLYATQIVIEPDIGPVNATGSRVVIISSGQTKLYKLTATNDWGWAYWQVLLASP